LSHWLPTFTPTAERPSRDLPARQVSSGTSFLGDIVGFEMERMILPTLAGLHVPGCNAIGDFSV
jgi:hypothetical protein